MRRFPMIGWLIAVVVLMRLAHDANPVLFTYYVMFKFHWSTAMVGSGSRIALNAASVLTEPAATTEGRPLRTRRGVRMTRARRRS